MWWTGDWSGFAPLMAIPFVLLCLGTMLLMMRMGPMHLCGSHATSRPRDDAGNSAPHSAFDEYRAETLQRLEHEQAEFVGFLDRLRAAKDKAEFDSFMAQRRTSAGA
jgi:hypothetical protein